MRYRDAIRIVEEVDANDGTLSLDPDDPSYDFFAAKQCIRRREQRGVRKGEPRVVDGDVDLTVTSNLGPRSGVRAWEASPLLGAVGRLVEKLLVDEGEIQ